MTKTWYRIRASRKVAELYIYGEIGAGGETAANLLSKLESFGEIKSINLRINSSGGDVFEAIAIHNALSRHPAEITVYIDAMCASAATLIALAGDTIHMASNALFMIHEPWSIAGGNASAFQKQADLLDTVALQVVGMYSRKTGQDGDVIREWMREETWYTAEQALAAGFVDVIDEPQKVAALVTHDLSRFNNPPLKETVVMVEKEMVESPIVETPQQPMTLEAVAISKMCLAANEPNLIPALLAVPLSEDVVKARIANAVKVRKVCESARQADKADALIAEGADEAAAMKACWDALVARDAVARIDNSPPDPIPAGLPLEQRCEMEWQRDPRLRAEFVELNVYQSFCRAQEQRRVKIHGGK